VFSFGKETNTLKSVNQTNQSIYPQYFFNVSYKNIDFKDIYISDTINKDTLINEKIAPGTNGTFEILLETDQEINYQIKFESENEKPENLIFRIDGQDRKYKNLEDMEDELKGKITKNKNIIIYWEWEYEKSEAQDLQDTKDGENIKKYNFTIYAIGQ
jgi:hypothetical protein